MGIYYVDWHQEYLGIMTNALNAGTQGAVNNLGKVITEYLEYRKRVKGDKDRLVTQPPRNDPVSGKGIAASAKD